MCSSMERCWDSLIAQLAKNLPAMQETRVQFLGGKDPLENKMATHSSILAWRIPWTQEPIGLQFMGVARVGHNLEAKSPPNQSCLVILLVRAADHVYLLKDNWETLKLVDQVA